MQLYLSAPAGKLDKPTEELKGFVKTKLLKPGETQQVTFVLHAINLASLDPDTDSWIAEAGTYTIKIGTSSLNIKQTGTFSVASDIVAEKVHDSFAADAKFED